MKITRKIPYLVVSLMYTFAFSTDFVFAKENEIVLEDSKDNIETTEGEKIHQHERFEELLKEQSEAIKGSLENVLPENEEPMVSEDEQKKPVAGQETEQGTVQQFGDYKEFSAATQMIIQSKKENHFTASDQYFRVIDDNVSIYDNSTSSLVHVGYLIKGQVYKRTRDYGDWHEIKFGDGFGYVWKASTEPADAKEILNLNKGLKGKKNYFISKERITVYDNSSGKLVPFAVLNKDIKYPYIGELGSDWYQIDVSGRIGYVYKPATKREFCSSDLFFRVLENNVSIYDNSTGSLVHVGYLKKGQVYKRTRDYGDWHQIQFGDGYGYVWKASTEPADGKGVLNFSNNIKKSIRLFSAKEPLTVYDNTSGSLVPFATITKGTKYPYIGRLGNDWYQIEVSGRIGYVYKPATKLEFLSTDRFFQVLEDNVSIYDNSTGSLIHVGYLRKGQIYERVSDYGDWHRIKFGDGYGYIWKASTEPADGSKIPNLNKGSKNSKNYFIPKEPLTVYDNSSGKLVPFAVLIKGSPYPYIKQFGSDWFEVDVAGRIGYVYRPATIYGVVYTQTNYNISLEEMWKKQLTVDNLTDKKYETFIRSDALTIDKTNNQYGTSNGVWNVRGGPSTSFWVVGKTVDGERIRILDKVYNEQDGYWWYKIEFNRQWYYAKPEDVKYYLDPSNVFKGSKEFFQFLVLSQSAGVNANEVNEKILKGKGILEGKAQAFINAARLYNINEIYLISHALLETGNGKSQLATGVLVREVNGQPVEPKVVYNMFGINARDSNPTVLGAEYAYMQGWFTPEDAIIGGAAWISSRYINNPSRKQDTLYKMKWNPANPATFNYATDIGWAYKQVTNIFKLYSLLESYVLQFDIPVYKN